MGDKRFTMLALLTIFVTLSACQRQGSGDASQAPDGELQVSLQKVTIGYQPTVFYSYLFLAEDLGMFESAGLDAELVRIPSANEMFQAFLAGQLDMTGLTATEILLRGHEVAPGSFFLPLMVELGPENVADRIIVLNDSPIRTVADLAGKKIGSHPGTTVPNILRAVLKRNAVIPGSVEIQTLKPDLQVESVLSGAVDAIICLEPTGTELLVSGKTRVLVEHPFGEIVTQFPASFSALGKEFVDENPDAADRLVQVIRAAVLEYRNKVENDPGYIAELLQEHLGTSPEVASALSAVDYKLPEEWNAEDNAKVIRFYLNSETISSSINLEGLAIPSTSAAEKAAA